METKYKDPHAWQTEQRPILASSTPDRVSYSFSRKINLGNYESMEIRESYSTDVMEGETREQALARAAAFVERTVEARLGKILEDLG